VLLELQDLTIDKAEMNRHKAGEPVGHTDKHLNLDTVVVRMFGTSGSSSSAISPAT